MGRTVKRHNYLKDENSPSLNIRFLTNWKVLAGNYADISNIMVKQRYNLILINTSKKETSLIVHFVIKVILSTFDTMQF